MALDLNTILNSGAMLDPQFLADIFKKHGMASGDELFLQAADALTTASDQGRRMNDEELKWLQSAITTLPETAAGYKSLDGLGPDTSGPPSQDVSGSTPKRSEAAVEYNKMYDATRIALERAFGRTEALPQDMLSWVQENNLNNEDFGIERLELQPPVNPNSPTTGGSAFDFPSADPALNDLPGDPSRTRFPARTYELGKKTPLTGALYKASDKFDTSPEGNAARRADYRARLAAKNAADSDALGGTTDSLLPVDPLDPNTPPPVANTLEGQPQWAQDLATTQRAQGLDGSQIMQNIIKESQFYNPDGTRKAATGLKDGGVIRPEAAIIHVGERAPNDGSKYATDEFIYADPGSDGEFIVAPRPKNVKPTLKNAVKLLMEKRDELTGGRARKKQKKLVKAQEGLFKGSSNILQLLLQSMISGTNMATQLPGSQANIMSQLGFINPNALGITDPEEFRSILSSGSGNLETSQSKQFGQNLSQALSMFMSQLGLDETLGKGSLEIQRMNAGNQAAATQGQLELGRGDLDLRKILGMGQLRLGEGRLSLDELLGKGQLSLGQGRLTLDELLGKGQLGLGEGQLQLGRDELAQMGELKGEELELLRRRISGEEEERGFQRSIRGLKALPAVGNVASGMPTAGTAGIV